MNFDSEYKKLNKNQKLAVDTIDGPVMVIAGPGTGKTQILTLRIANILKKIDVEPENILAITFTESGVGAMRTRLANLIGPEAYSVNITTFHAFCNSIIQDFPESFNHIIGSSPIDELEQIKILEEVILDLKLALLKPFGDVLHYLKAIRAGISDLKRENVSPAKFKEILTLEEKDFESIEDLYHVKGAFKGKMKTKYQVLEKQIAKNKELLTVYSEYQKVLHEKKLYDFTDMIMEVVAGLEKDSDLLYQLQERYQYVLVDEHQDTNNGQNRLLELLMNFHKNPNLFVVGDEKQAIFRFQGASLENFLYFKQLYVGAKLISLKENYRSTQGILDGAYSLSPGVERVRLVSQNKASKEKIKVASCSTSESENYFIASRIKNQIKNGVDGEQIAVLYRDNKDALGLANMLEKLGVAFRVESDQNVFEDDDIEKLLTLFKAIGTFGSSEELVRLLHADFLEIDALDTYKLIQERDNDVYDTMRSSKKLESLGIQEVKKLNDLYQKIAGWRKLAEYQNVSTLFELVVRESGFLAYILGKPNSVEKLEKLNGLFDEIKKLVEKHRRFLLRDWLDYLRLLQEHDLLVRNVAVNSGLDSRVSLMTVHKSKGREFDYVYISGVSSGHFGARRVKNLLKLPSAVFQLVGRVSEEFDGEADERNLFYVGLTRARKEAVISYALTNQSGKEQLASQFILEIEPKHMVEIDTKKYEAKFNKERDVIFGVGEGPNKVSVGEADFVKRVFLDRGLSVTGLNNYLECPWKWFYTNLLRIPEAKNKHMMYGTAVHKALQDLFDKMRQDEKFTKQDLLNSFYKALDKEPIIEREYKELKDKGKKALSGYFEQYHKDWGRYKSKSEMHIPAVMLKVGKDEIRLNGKLDRVDFIGENEVKVTDYKTGKPKSRKELMGETKNANENYYRQLVFYKLLLTYFEDGKYKMSSGVIDFIEADDKGRFHQEAFEITEKQVKELEDLVKEKVKEILSLGFWDGRCKDKKCEYCKLRSLIS